MKVIFSDRAYKALLAETYEKIKTETGGIFLGFYEGETWYVVETIDPGPTSIFEIAYFEYDQKYVTHLINKVARLYRKNLKLIGLWHRHPGSFDVFSGTDDGTNRKYAQMSPEGAISGLVNIDPRFRLKIFHVPADLRYKTIPYEVGDSLFPEGSLELWSTDELLKKINGDKNGDFLQSLRVRTESVMKLSELMASVCTAENEFDAHGYKDEIESASKEDDFIDRVSGELMEDLEYLAEEADMPIVLKRTAHFLCLTDDNEEAESRLYFSMVKSLDKIVFIYKQKCYNYSSGMFSKVIQEGIKSEVPDSFWSKVKKFFTK